jgi:hypothetical protein
MLNLVINARDAMPTGGGVQIATDRWEAQAVVSGGPAPGAYVRVRIKDIGQGMPQKCCNEPSIRFSRRRARREPDWVCRRSTRSCG